MRSVDFIRHTSPEGKNQTLNFITNHCFWHSKNYHLNYLYFLNNKPNKLYWLDKTKKYQFNITTVNKIENVWKNIDR